MGKDIPRSCWIGARQGKAARRQKLKPGTGHAEASQARIPSSPPSYPFAGNKRPSGPEEVNCGSGSLQIIWPILSGQLLRLGLTLRV